ncbi:hypothetical protein, partial [Exiguobacterium artemiae]
EYDMSQNQERLIMDTQDMNGLLDATKKDLEEHQKQLNERIDSLKELDFDESVNLDLKPNLLNKVSMSNDTFLELKKRAEVAERMQRALRISDQRVQALEKDNRKKDSQLGEMFTLRMENSSLKRQVEFFKQVIDKMRELFLKQKDKEGQPKVSEKLVSQIIGFSKHYVGQGLKMNKEAEPQNEHEKTGRDVAIKALAAERKEKGYGSEMER